MENNCPHNNWGFHPGTPNRCTDCGCSAVAMVNSLQSENARLKEALETIDRKVELTSHLKFRRIARKALGKPMPDRGIESMEEDDTHFEKVCKQLEKVREEARKTSNSLTELGTKYGLKEMECDKLKSQLSQARGALGRVRDYTKGVIIGQNPLTRTLDGISIIVVDALKDLEGR